MFGAVYGFHTVGSDGVDGAGFQGDVVSVEGGELVVGEAGSFAAKDIAWREFVADDRIGDLSLRGGATVCSRGCEADPEFGEFAVLSRI